MMSKRSVLAALVVGSVTLTGSALPAHAGEVDQGASPATVDSLAQQVDQATSDELKKEDVAAKETSTGSFASTGMTEVVIPAVASGDVTASRVTEEGTYTISVGTGSNSSAEGALASDGSVVYDQAGDTDRTVQATDDGFRIHTVIAEASAPTEYVHDVTLPAGTRLAFADQLPTDSDDPGVQGAATPSGVLILDSEDNLIGGFGSPWATDANGTPVDTRFEIRGDALVQVVNHQRPGVAYPVVADPYLGFDMIKNSVWDYYSGYGWILRVTPTGWSRSLAGSYVAGVYGWRELYQKRRNSGLNTNLDGMRDQYICHQQIVAIRAPRRATWNLDEWRPNVSYAQTVNASCNPGGPVWFD